MLSIDLETYSDVDLANCGVYRYVEGDFHILLLLMRLTMRRSKIVDLACGEELPKEVMDAIFDENIIKVHGTRSSSGPVFHSSSEHVYPQTPGSALWYGQPVYPCR